MTHNDIVNIKIRNTPAALRILTSLLAVLAGLAVPGANRTARGPEPLEQLLERFPNADTDKDGKLTPEEARAYLRKARSATEGIGAAKPPEG